MIFFCILSPFFGLKKITFCKSGSAPAGCAAGLFCSYHSCPVHCTLSQGPASTPAQSQELVWIAPFLSFNALNSQSREMQELVQDLHSNTVYLYYELLHSALHYIINILHYSTDYCSGQCTLHAAHDTLTHFHNFFYWPCTVLPNSIPRLRVVGQGWGRGGRGIRVWGQQAGGMIGRGQRRKKHPRPHWREHGVISVSSSIPGYTLHCTLEVEQGPFCTNHLGPL